jgi:hypothetical protein
MTIYCGVDFHPRLSDEGGHPRLVQALRPLVSTRVKDALVAWPLPGSKVKGSHMTRLFSFSHLKICWPDTLQ